MCYFYFLNREANNLWGSLETIEDINDIVSLWLLTLEKQVSKVYRFRMVWLYILILT